MQFSQQFPLLSLFPSIAQLVGEQMSFVDANPSGCPGIMVQVQLESQPQDYVSSEQQLN